MPSRRVLEVDYQKALLARMALEFRAYSFFSRSTGVLKVEDRIFRASLPGQCDLWGIEHGTARHFELEVKRFGKLSDKQERWRDWCIERGIPWRMVEAHKTEEPTQTVDRWIEEMRLWLVPRAP